MSEFSGRSELGGAIPGGGEVPYDHDKVRQTTEHRRAAFERGGQFRPRVSRLRRLLMRLTHR